MPYRCLICGEVCSTVTGLKRHIVSNHVHKDYCPICHRELDSIMRLKRHAAKLAPKDPAHAQLAWAIVNRKRKCKYKSLWADHAYVEDRSSRHVPYTVSLPKSLIFELEKYSRDTGLTKNMIVKEALRWYLSAKCLKWKVEVVCLEYSDNNLHNGGWRR